MKDFQTQFEEATNKCSLCNNEFTEERFCCCCDGRFELDSKVRHTNGVCTVCCKHRFERNGAN